MKFPPRFWLLWVGVSAAIPAVGLLLRLFSESAGWETVILVGIAPIWFPVLIFLQALPPLILYWRKRWRVPRTVMTLMVVHWLGVASVFLILEGAEEGYTEPSPLQNALQDSGPLGPALEWAIGMVGLALVPTWLAAVICAIVLKPKPGWSTSADATCPAPVSSL